MYFNYFIVLLIIFFSLILIIIVQIIIDLNLFFKNYKFCGINMLEKHSATTHRLLVDAKLKKNHSQVKC